VAGSVGRGSRAVGTITRGTTNTNRLRRVDRWIASRPELTRARDPLVVDLGYGASGVTTFELYERLLKVRPDVEVLGLEIDPERVRVATEQLRARTGGTATGTRTVPSRDAHAGPDSGRPAPAVSFARGGFEIPLPDARRPILIRAMNVLRQYDESEVLPAWHMLADRLQGDGVAIDGTCDEIGRVCSWVALGAAGPRTLTVSLRLTGLESPSIVAERLVKILIHRNVEGEAVHRLIADLDAAWRSAAPLATFSPTQRWIAAVRIVKDAGWPVLDGPTRWRLGEVTLPWDSVAPDGFSWSAPAAGRRR
jgi:hypothetical protein